MDKETFISIRVAFACAALQGMLAAGGANNASPNEHMQDIQTALAFEYADKMMKRLQASL